MYDKKLKSLKESWKKMQINEGIMSSVGNFIRGDNGVSPEESATADSKSKEELLTQSLNSGKVSTALKLINSGVDVNALKNEDSPLLLASGHGYTEVVNALIQAGADVHVNDDTALRAASLYGHTEIVKALINAGADIHSKNDYPLLIASENGNTEVVQELINAGAEINTDDDAAFRKAIRFNNPEIVKLLIDAGADVHADEDYSWRTAMYFEDGEIIKLLKPYFN